jgi:predicted phosphodiesterase
MKRMLVLILLAIAFISSPVSAERLRFAVIGDTQGDFLEEPVSDEAFAKIVDLVLEAEPAVQFVVHTGDLVSGKLSNRLVSDFELWRTIADPWYQADFLGLKVYPTPGNHDQLNPTSSQEAWQTAFPELPDNGPENQKKMTYSFDHGECHFVVVNTSTPNLSGQHVVDNDWLAEDLANSDKPVTFVFGHEPAYPMSRHIGSSLDARPEKRDRFWQILAENGVGVYFCGHEHRYDHWMKDGVHQIITGSGGVPSVVFNYLIVDVDDENNVTVSVYDANNNSLMDQFDLADTENVAKEERTGEADPFYQFLDTCPCFFFIVFLAGFGYVGVNLISDGSMRK